MVEVYAVNTERTIKEALFERLLSLLPEDRQRRIKKFRKPEDAKCSLLAELLVRTLAHSRLNIGNEEIVIVRDEYGKPLLNSRSDFHFNISHSGAWVMCAVHHMPVGVDVEKIQPIDLGIARRFFSKTEYSDLLNMESGKRLSYFYELWTLKESYIKAVGKGLSIPLDSFSFRLHDNGIRFETDGGCGAYYFKQYGIDNGYKAAVCSRAEDFPGEAGIKEFDEICREALRM